MGGAQGQKTRKEEQEDPLVDAPTEVNNERPREVNFGEVER